MSMLRLLLLAAAASMIGDGGWERTVAPATGLADYRDGALYRPG
jgi:hypothetical protein